MVRSSQNPSTEGAERTTTGTIADTGGKMFKPVAGTNCQPLHVEVKVVHSALRTCALTEMSEPTSSTVFTPGYSTIALLSTQKQEAAVLLAKSNKSEHTNWLLVVVPFLLVNESNDSVMNVPSSANIARVNCGVLGSAVVSNTSKVAPSSNTTSSSSAATSSLPRKVPTTDKL